MEGIEEKRDVYRILVGKSKGNRSLGRPRLKSLDNIKMDIEEIDLDGVD
jgi:hypothetical protein